MKDINVSLKTIAPTLKKRSQPVVRHAPFIATLAVLLVYLLLVARVSSFTSAEPTPEDETVALAKTAFPKIDKEAIKQIEALEQGSPELKILLDAARRDPFKE
ncbi:hypothetical protein A3A68_02390 [Candidatus Saccharibacteria bacterium RIFCSPLOWO2_01_FULL_48_13]|nr:MAG: hypothetical protein A2884_00100 [Candidatus Saccharibacteria bacterium RIFCSPHIGHO2_01_FULL_48_12]OGL36071.1 MAG: hypothetical protein A3F38_00505 [Candidatus Saccharibacteria bacterium RIFCSPHIGHO2_12_FULL_48_21]OGL36770.1 MAG: hypothetical protein A3A68_02390 [Candidatus Saccharibacteria bacterium RIFCSPLOWO2_01_FULL_48_13]